MSETLPARVGTAPLPPNVRAWANTGTGVHSIPRDQAVEMIRAPKPAASVDGEPGPLVWMDVTQPGDEEAIFLREVCGFHPLAVEDCVRGRQRPKLDRYPGYYFLVIYAAAVNPKRNRMALNELHLFLGNGFLVTVHDYKVEEITEIVARWRTGTRPIHDSGALAHLLLDVVVDDYFPVTEHFADRVEKIEDAVFHRAEAASVPQILLLRHELMLFRKIVAPQREVLSALLRRDIPFLRPELVPYFQDVHDHTIRVTEEIDTLRELLSGLLDAQMTASANQLNQTVRVMTGWSIILMSMALIAGIYGMNFDTMPELHWRWGYPFAVGTMLAVGGGFFMLFRKKGWL